MKKLIFLSLFFTNFYVVLSQVQSIKNADFSDHTPSETGKLADGNTVNYYNIEGDLIRSMLGKEFVYYKTVIESIIVGVDAGWINSPNWKRKFDWNYGTTYANGMRRLKKEDEKNEPNRFVITNIFQPSKGHTLYQYMINMNDSLYKPMTAATKPRDYLWKVQNYENKTPRLAVNIHVNELFKTTSISGFKELDWKTELKTPYKVYKANDSIWYNNEDLSDQDANDMRFQKNTAYLIIGSSKDVGFTKGMNDDLQECFFMTYPITQNNGMARLNMIIIELIGHDESIKLFFDRIDWKKIDEAFKIIADN